MDKRPNVVFIQCDSMDGRRIGCMGYPGAYTPNIDRLAAGGVIFRNAYCNSPICVPSRASMWSGRHIHNIKAWNNFKGLSKEDTTFQDILEANGYTVGIAGRTDHLSGSHSYKARVCAWTRSANITLPQKKRYTAEIMPDERVRVFEKDWEDMETAKEWLENHAHDEKPFFLHVGFYIPHPEYITSNYWLKKIDADKIPMPRFEEKLHPVIEFMSRAKSCLEPVDAEYIVNIRRIYQAMVAETDALAGEVIDAVGRAGLLGDTYLIFLSDHGEMTMEHRLLMKSAMYDASTRVPLIIAGPGVKKGIAADTPVSLVDIFPTLMDIAGIPYDGDLDGESLMPVLSGVGEVTHRSVLAQFHADLQNTGSFMLRKDRWKYVAYPGYQPQLFNLQEDPDEMKNLAVELSGVAVELDRELREMVDYDAVDKKVKEWDKACFRQWKASVSEAEYWDIMRKCYMGFDNTQEEKIREWISR